MPRVTTWRARSASDLLLTCISSAEFWHNGTLYWWHHYSTGILHSQDTTLLFFSYNKLILLHWWWCKSIVSCSQVWYSFKAGLSSQHNTVSRQLNQVIFSWDMLDLTSTLVRAFRLRPPASSTTVRSGFIRSKVRKCLLSFLNGIPSPYPSPWIALSTPKSEPNNPADSDECLHPVRSTYPPLCQTQSEAALCLLSI